MLNRTVFIILETTMKGETKNKINKKTTLPKFEAAN